MKSSKPLKEKKMISRLKPFMAYLPPEQHERLKKVSEETEIAMSQLVREGIDSRLSGGDKFVAGYNKAIEDCIAAIKNNRVSQMSFPSGKTFGDVFTEDIKQLVISNEKETFPSTKELVSRIHAGESEAESASIARLGL
jgi:predicted DNA-binding protein